MNLSLDLTMLLAVALLLFVGVRSHWTGRLLALLLLSPGLRYGMAVFGFPIRLQLSTWAGALLHGVGMNVAVEGNVLIRDGVEMAVDPACMGLQMTGVSVLVALFLLIWHEKQTQRRVSTGWVAAYGLAVVGLTLVCNLIRIVLLVVFGAMPDTAAHESIGLACVLVYAWLPAWGLAWALVRYTGWYEASDDGPGQKAALSRSGVWGFGLVTLGVGLMAFAARPTNVVARPNPVILRTIDAPLSESTPRRARLAVAYAQQMLPGGTLKLTRPNRLVYLKPQPDWFSSDHSPMVCWRGSGYDLRHVRETTLNGHPAYAAELVRNGQVLQTAWWFTNGQATTISQVTMRSLMLRGQKGFVLVNVTWSLPRRIGQ